MIPSWISFVILLIIIFSKKELGIVLSIGALIFGFLTQVNVIISIITVFIDPSIILLALSVSLIPILGGIMEESGLMLELIQKMNVSKRTALMVSPALFGLLPIAGGALMSAPIVDQIDPDLDSNRKVSINVWYRHALVLIYPISSSIIVSSILSGISIYVIILAMIVPFIIMIIVGYFILLRSVDKEVINYNRDLKRVFRNLFPIVIAPLIDFFGRLFFNLSYPEIFLFIGMCVSILVAIKFAHMKFSDIKGIAKKMQIWRFPLLIFAMFLFLDIFEKSGVPEEIGALKLPFLIFIFIAFFLGFTTGRVQVPISILIPIYLIQNLVMVMPLIDFVFLYFAAFLGYLITPIHPCFAYSLTYYKTDYKKAFKYLATPTFICFGILLIIYVFITLL
jgi:integral membrane protein (TIGR00529 family)